MLKPAWCSLPNEANAIIPMPKIPVAALAATAEPTLEIVVTVACVPVGSGRQFFPVARDQKQRVVDPHAVRQNHRIDVDSFEQSDARSLGAPSVNRPRKTLKPTYNVISGTSVKSGAR